MPLKERSKLLCNRYLCKTLSNSKSPVYNVVHDYFTFCSFKKKSCKRIIRICIENMNEIIKKKVKVQKHFSIYNYDYKVISTAIPVDFEFGKELKESINPNLLLDSMISNQNVYCIYTDGSKINGNNSVGSAVICPNLNARISKSIDKDASIFTAESIALIDAVNLALKNSNFSFYIFSDSQSALYSLSNTKNTISTNANILEIKKKYLEFHTNNPNSNIKFFWIPAHVGIRGNEEADVLAKNATKCPLVMINKLHFTDVYAIYKQNAQNNSKSFIKDSGLEKGKKYFSNYYKESNVPWFYNKNLERNLIVTIKIITIISQHL